MLPLNTVDANTRTIADPQRLQDELTKLRAAGVTGVMVDVWWGIVERDERQYHFEPYVQLAQLAQKAGLRLQCVLSFHQCGGNVGDTCDIKVPAWARAAGTASHFYTDQHGNRNYEYVSLFADDVPLFGGGARTPLDAYGELMHAFAAAMKPYAGATLDEVQVGLGPAGELRYSAYPLARWQYCGVGEFQSYDQYAMASLRKAADAVGHPEWAHRGGPANAGDYNARPDDSAPFFTASGHDNYASAYGRFYLEWYASQLEEHGRRVLTNASSVFAPLGVKVAAKVSGIHWWYGAPSHAAELTSGYYNTNGQDAYKRLATKAMKPANAVFDFTCLEMFDQDYCASRPEQLVYQTLLAAKNASLAGYAGENALPLCYDSGCDENGFQQVLRNVQRLGTPPTFVTQFTMLRLTDALLREPAYSQFRSFVERMLALG
mmetsp:Transcript_12859/g.31792  ORF Transcript_12859/g.31792 Transcript_12859/m.31792 type:complete len:433 (+) Transcript_12859:750-2048(+)